MKVKDKTQSDCSYSSGVYIMEAQPLVQIQALAFTNGTAKDNYLTAVCLTFLIGTAGTGNVWGMY